MNYKQIINERDANNGRHLNIGNGNTQVRPQKRYLLLLIMAFFLLFAGTQAPQSVKAVEACAMVCGEPYIDPNDGQCYQQCCPANEECKSPCYLILCK